MTTTDEFRALLDKRGVEWWEGWDKDLTLFDGTNGVRWIADHVVGEWFIRSVLPITTEQAIAATLGSSNCSNSERTGTCRLVPTRDKPRSKAPTLTCSECGWWTADIGAAWNYCPNCGRKAVG